MGDDIGLGSVCLDFCSANVVQLSNWKNVIYGCLTTIDDSLSLDPNRCHYPLITYLRKNKQLSFIKKLMKMFRPIFRTPTSYTPTRRGLWATRWDTYLHDRGVFSIWATRPNCLQPQGTCLQPTLPTTSIAYSPPSIAYACPSLLAYYCAAVASSVTRGLKMTTKV